MELKPIVKKAVVGGVVAAVMCSNFGPLAKMNLTGFDVYGAVNAIYQFQKTKEYNDNFNDVKQSDWYYASAAKAYAYDLVNGKSDTKFDPSGNITIAEAITMASKLNSYGMYGELSASIQMEADPWYTLFVRYAETKGIIKTGEFAGEYNRPATRDELAHIFANALPAEGYQQMNVVKTLPDIDASNKYYNDVVKLYNAGIISGNDYLGTFTPKANITRAEAAAIISRLALPSTRVKLTFCESIAFPSKDDSFGPLDKIGTQVVERPKDEDDVEKDDVEKETPSTSNKPSTSTSTSTQNPGRNENDENDEQKDNSGDASKNEEPTKPQKPSRPSYDDDDWEEEDKSSESSEPLRPSYEDEEGEEEEVWDYNGVIYDTYEEYLDAIDKDKKAEDAETIANFASGTLELVNEARAEEGLPPLELDPDLVEAAEIRAQELSELFSHTRPDGSRGTSIIDDLRIPCTVSAENISRGGGVSINIQDWLASSGHRAQIMGERYQTYGAAIYQDDNGSVFAIQIFNRETPFDD